MEHHKTKEHLVEELTEAGHTPATDSMLSHIRGLVRHGLQPLLVCTSVDDGEPITTDDLHIEGPADLYATINGRRVRVYADHPDYAFAVANDVSNSEMMTGKEEL